MEALIKRSSCRRGLQNERATAKTAAIFHKAFSVTPGLPPQPPNPNPPRLPSNSHTNTLPIFLSRLQLGEGAGGKWRDGEERGGRGGGTEGGVREWGAGGGGLLLSRSDRVKRQCRCNLSSMAVWEE